MKKIFAVMMLVIGSSAMAFGQFPTSANWWLWPPPQRHNVPEIDPGSGMSALALLSGALLVIRGRRKAKG